MLWGLLFIIAIIFWPLWGWAFALGFLIAWRVSRRRANQYQYYDDMRNAAQNAVQLAIQHEAVTNLVVERAKRELQSGQ